MVTYKILITVSESMAGFLAAEQLVEQSVSESRINQVIDDAQDRQQTYNATRQPKGRNIPFGKCPRGGGVSAPDFGSQVRGFEILPEPKQRLIAQSLSCSPFHHLEMTEIL